MDLSTLEAEATLDLWDHQLERLRNEGSVRTITRELHMAQSVPAVRIRAFKNGEGSRGNGEIIIGSSIHAVCMSGYLLSNTNLSSRKCIIFSVVVQSKEFGHSRKSALCMAPQWSLGPSDFIFFCS